MPKVLLIKPYYIDEGDNSLYASIPIGLLSLATLLHQKGIEVRLVDTMAKKNYFDDISEYLEDTALIGITAMTTQVKHGIEIVKKIKKINKTIPIVWGGVHPTLFPEESLKSDFCDIVVPGEGDETLLDLYSAILGEKKLKDVLGIYYADSHGAMKSNEMRPLMENIPNLNYELLGNVEPYILNDLSPITPGVVRSLQIHVGRGCYYKCTFCSENYDMKRRGKAPEILIEEINELTERFNIEYFDIQDSDFFANKKDMVCFVELAKNNPKPFKWFANCRVNYFNKFYINESFAKELEDSGCIRLGMGIESGSERILKKMKKNISVKGIKKCIRIMNKTSIKSSFSFMIGFPDENEKDMTLTLGIIIYIFNNCRNFYFIGPAIFRPYPGSEMYREAVNLGYQSPKTFEDWVNLDFDRHGYVNQKYLKWLTGQTEWTMAYVRSIIDYWHFKKKNYTYPLFVAYDLILKFRFKFNFWNLLVEHLPLIYIRMILERLRSKGYSIPI